MFFLMEHWKNDCMRKELQAQCGFDRQNNCNTNVKKPVRDIQPSVSIYQKQMSFNQSGNDVYS